MVPEITITIRFATGAADVSLGSSGATALGEQLSVPQALGHDVEPSIPPVPSADKADAQVVDIPPPPEIDLEQAQFVDAPPPTDTSAKEPPESGPGHIRSWA